MNPGRWLGRTDGTSSQRYRDRADAGRRLAQALASYADRPQVRVLALPRGGVPVAFEVAAALHAPLDVFLVRKLGVPGHQELALGAIAEGGVRVLNDDVLRSLHLGQGTIDQIAARESEELARRSRAYRGGRPPTEVKDCEVLLVDDGLATGATMRAAIKAVSHLQPARLVVAVPVGARETCAQIEHELEPLGRLVCPLRPVDFYAVGVWYEDFAQTSDEEVRALLQQAATLPPSTPRTVRPPAQPGQ
jgi:putative phosphoribosyl transferase